MTDGPIVSVTMTNVSPTLFAALSRLLNPPRIARGFLGLFNGDGTMSNASVSVDGTGLLATLSFQDDKGNAAQPISPPVWNSTDVTVATATAAADGMSAQIALPGKSGSASITVSAEGGPNPGDDVVNLSADLTVTAGRIKGGEINFTENPPANPPINPSNN